MPILREEKVKYGGIGILLKQKQFQIEVSMKRSNKSRLNFFNFNITALTADKAIVGGLPTNVGLELLAPALPTKTRITDGEMVSRFELKQDSSVSKNIFSEIHSKWHIIKDNFFIIIVH